MRAPFSDEPEFVAVGYTQRNADRWKREAKRRGLTVEETIELAVQTALDVGASIPPKEGKILSFEALKSNKPAPRK